MASRANFLGLAIAVASVVSLFIAGPVVAQSQPTSVNPTASSVNERQLLEALQKDSSRGTPAVHGRVSIPDQRSGNLIQPGGQDWRRTHQMTMPTVGATVILGMLSLLALFFVLRGRIRITQGFSGVTIARFGGLDRFAHWLTAGAFMLLGLSGLNLTFGKWLLRPLIGDGAFTALTQAGKLVHNYVSFAFVAGLVLMLVLWIKDNLPHPRDWTWLTQGGGLVGSSHPPADRFNFGQKLIFWSVILGGGGLAVTGYLLMFPFRFTDLAGMQLAGILHGLIGAVLVAIILAHIYIGTLGMEGAFSAMGSGEVDLNWAKEHHSIWVEKVKADSPDAIRPGSAMQPAE